jgi:transcriptional regulator GlxA family with amidase domain
MTGSDDSPSVSHGPRVTQRRPPPLLCDPVHCLAGATSGGVAGRAGGQQSAESRRGETARTASGIPREVGFLVYPSFALLELSGPLEVFKWAEQMRPGSYRISVMSLRGGEVMACSGLPIMTRPVNWDDVDTLIVVGGNAVTTSSPRDMLNDTSPGLTSGIDMALTLVEADLGGDLAREIARRLVVDYRRPDGQCTYTSLRENAPKSDRIRRAVVFAREHLGENLSVERLAEVANLSVRQFSRVFRSATGNTPAKMVERLRLEAARPRVEDGREPLEIIAREVGFADPARMRQCFIRAFGRAPQAVRRSARAKTILRSLELPNAP